ncbi:MAG: hypothetical protein AAGF77_14230, partial [Bacteroidota bacterium]
MRTVSKLVLSYVIVLSLILLLAMGLHLAVSHQLKLAVASKEIIHAYSVNFILALIIFIGLFLARKRLPNALGFLFMGGSLLKFLVFFLFFYPDYRADGELQRTEFATFFI